jgi:GNAT superfamily N-acetyltransferase
MPRPNVQVQLDTPETAHKYEEPIFQLYHDTFSKPPYQWPDNEEAAFRQRLTRLARDATFGIATARTDEELVGFAYGYTLRPDTSWWQGFITPVPEELTTEWEGRTFALVDFAVAAAWRGQGIGRRLHDTLLSSRHESRATLAMEPAAHEARAVYECWGWRVVGRLWGPATDFAPEFDIMVRDLPLT